MVNGGLSSHVWWPEISPIPSWLTSFFIGHGGWACRTLGASSQESINMHSGRFTHTNTHGGVFQLINDSIDNTCMPVRIVNWIFRFFKSSKRYIGNWTTTGDIMHPFISKNNVSHICVHNPDETPHDRIYETVTCLQRCNIHGDPIHHTSHPLEIARCSF